MDQQIPQSFKVQWLNTTLKFIKDDSQLVKDYPQMPSSHVEYLHNLIWQRKNDVGLGFKSLYSPVWEAMKIYSVKYKFKIFVEKSEDGMSGHLIMEKIPKTGEPAIYDNDEKKDKENSCEKLEKDDDTVQNNEVAEETQTESVKCKLESKKSKTKKRVPHKSKSLKTFLENQKILDSLSPLFIKETLKSILDFITDELYASKIFCNLAPIESRFLENFLSIYQRRDDFQEMLSPACIEIFYEISNCFDDFNKTCRLDISAVSVNENTNKRQVKYTKVPVFPSKKKAKQKMEKNVSEGTKNNKSKNKTKTLNNGAVCEDVNSKPIDNAITPIDNNIKETLSKYVKKVDNVKPKTMTCLKNRSLNKSVLLPKFMNYTKEEISSTADTSYIIEDKKSPEMEIIQDTSLPSTSEKTPKLLKPKKSINFTKEGTSSTTDIPYVRGEQKYPNLKILQDMCVPLTSDKGLRMMQIMGWKGGALGTRGDGIIEPIIPVPNFKFSGLGHVPTIKESNKINKKNNRSEFINKILEMIDNDIDMSVIKLQNKILKREIKFWKLTLTLLNERMTLDVEFDKGAEIKDKMKKNPDIIFKMDFDDENKQITLTKTTILAEDTKNEANSKEQTILNTKAKFKAFILRSILELIKSDANEKFIQFNKNLAPKRIKSSNIIVLLINERQSIKQKNSEIVASLSSKVLDAIEDIQLSVSISEKEKYIVIRKELPKTNIDKEITEAGVNEAENTEDNKSAFDNVRSHLPTKMKNRLLNALYKYEMEDTEEFKKNEWYNTVDKCLLETKTNINAINHDTKIINKTNNSKINNNNTRTVEHDQNNNGDISVTVYYDNS